MRRNRHLKNSKTKRGREYAELALAELERQFPLASEIKKRKIMDKIQGWRVALKRWDAIKKAQNG